MPELSESAKLDAAIAAQKRLLAREPGRVDALVRLGGLLMRARKLGEAVQVFRRARARAPDHPQVHEGTAQLARVLTQVGARHAGKGETRPAMDALQAAVDVNPGCALETYVRLGRLLDLQDDSERALRLWRQAVEHHPTSGAAQVNLGNVLRKLRRSAEAEAAYREAIRINPRDLHAYRSLADLCAQEGSKLNEALALCKKIQELLPEDPDAIANEANVLELLGKPREAHALLQPVVAAGHRSTHLALAFGRCCQRVQPPSGEALPLLREELLRPGLRDESRSQLLRALALLHDVLGQPDEAFLCLQQAKHLDAGRFADSREDLLGVIERSLTEFTAQRMASLPRARHGSERPVFIVGMPRSGTSLAEQILASHPRVFGAGELTTVIGLARTALATGLPYPDCFRAWTQQRVEGSAQYYLRQLQELAPDALRVTDKMPFNFLHLGMIEVLFPNARVVHCSRDALDTCISCYFMEFTPKLSIFNDLTTLGRYYRGYRRLMRHWPGVLTLPMYELNYETLLAEPERVVRELVAFCGLEWDDACMKFHETKRQVRTFSYHQVRKPLYTQSMGRARAYARHLGPLVEALGDELDEERRATASGDAVA